MGRSAPIRSKRGHLKAPTHTPLCDVGDQAPSSAPKAATLSETTSPIPGALSSVLLAPCPVLMLLSIRGGDLLSPLKASESFCGSVACTEPRKVFLGIQGTQSHALCCAAQWLKSSQERLSGKYTDGTDRASLGSAKGRKVRYFAPLCGLAGPRNRAHSHFPDNL